MSLASKELQFVNLVGPRPVMNERAFSALVYEIYPEEGFAHFEKKLLSNRKLKNDIIVTAINLQKAILKSLFNGEIPLNRGNGLYKSSEPAVRSVKSFSEIMSENEGVSLNSFILEAIKAGDHKEKFDETLPFTIEYKDEGQYFTVTQTCVDVEVYETSNQLQGRLLSIFNSYFKRWTEALQQYNDLIKNLEEIEKTTFLNQNVKAGIIEGFLSSLETPEHVEQFEVKISLRDFVLAHAK